MKWAHGRKGVVACLEVWPIFGRGPGSPPPLILGKRKKKSRKEEKPAEQAKQNHPLPYGVPYVKKLFTTNL